MGLQETFSLLSPAKELIILLSLRWSKTPFINIGIRNCGLFSFFRTLGNVSLPFSPSLLLRLTSIHVPANPKEGELTQSCRGSVGAKTEQDPQLNPPKHLWMMAAPREPPSASCSCC